MQTRITARHFKASPETTEYAEKAIMRLEKYYDGITDAHLILDVDEGAVAEKWAELAVNVYRQKLIARETAPTHKEAIQRCTEQVRKQILRYKTKRRAKNKTDKEQATYQYVQ